MPHVQRIRDLALQLFQSLWFVPAIIVAAHVLLAALLVGIDLALFDTDDHGLPNAAANLFEVGPDGARAVLSTIATALISAAGVTLSGVLVALSLAASQYTSRILRELTAKRVHQVSVGLILGAFVYSLVVLSTIDSDPRTVEDPSVFVPEFATLVAVLLAVVGVSALVLFVHSVSRAIQVGEILASIARDCEESLRNALPESDGNAERAEEAPVAAAALGDTTARWQMLKAHRSGYLRAIDCDTLADAAKKHDAVLRQERATGDFVVEGQPLVGFTSAGEDDPDVETLQSALDGAVSIGTFRTVPQDPGYGIRQMVDIALRALSPGVNDTTTAVMAVHRIRQTLTYAASRGRESEVVRRDGCVRFLRRTVELPTLLKEGVVQIRRCAQGNTAVAVTLGETLLAVARGTNERDALDAIAAEARALDQTARSAIAAEPYGNEARDWTELRRILDALDAHLAVGSATPRP